MATKLSSIYCETVEALMAALSDLPKEHPLSHPVRVDVDEIAGRYQTIKVFEVEHHSENEPSLHEMILKLSQSRPLSDEQAEMIRQIYQRAQVD